MALSNPAFRDFANSYKTSELLFAADGVGMFELFATQPRVEMAVAAEKLHIDPDTLLMFVGALATIGVLQIEETTISLTEDFSILNPSVEGSQLPYLRYAKATARKWSELTDCLRDRSISARNEQEVFGATESATRDFLGAMNANAAPIAAFLSNRYDFKGRRVADLGAGAGTYGVAIAKKAADADIVLVELPEVAPITHSLVEADLPGRFAVLSGSYLSDDIVDVTDAESRPFDDVLLMATVHQHSPDQVRGILERAKRMLAKGGRILITSFFTDDGGTTPRFAALFGAEMIVMMGKGRAYRIGEMVEMLTDAGFANVDVVEEVPGPARLITATAP